MSHTFQQLPRPQPRKPQAHEGSLIAAALLLGYAMVPRLWIIGFWIFGGMLGDAYSSWILPALGFVIAPWTTLLYAWMWAIGSTEVSGWEWLPVVIGVVLDLAFLAALARLRR
jgi:hypothetical protein